jgi:aspartyl aminopeptidase
MENKNTWEKYTKEQIEACMTFNEGYKKFLSECKTERECVERIREDIEKAGYKDMESLIG